MKPDDPQSGNSITDEFGFACRGLNCRGQGYSKAIVCCQAGDWGNVREMSW